MVSSNWKRSKAKNGNVTYKYIIVCRVCFESNNSIYSNSQPIMEYTLYTSKFNSVLRTGKFLWMMCTYEPHILTPAYTFKDIKINTLFQIWNQKGKHWAYLIMKLSISRRVLRNGGGWKVQAHSCICTEMGSKRDH